MNKLPIQQEPELVNSKKNFIIRRAEDKDFDRIFEIWEINQAKATGHQLTGYDSSQLKDELYRLFNLKNGYFFVAESTESKEILGWQSLLPLVNNPINSKYIAESTTYIDCRNHKQDVGSAIIQYAYKYAEETEIRQIFGWARPTNNGMLKIADKFGYKQYATIPASLDKKVPEMNLYIYHVPKPNQQQ